jgi:hypothetical protein
LIVEKQTIPADDPQQFTFTGDAADTIGDNGQIVVGGLVPGTYTSTETVPGGWTLTDITCNDTDSSGDLGTKTATFNLDAGEVVKCTFTDTKLGTIVVEKQTIPDGDPATFEFTGTANGTIADNGQIIVTNLPPDNYTSTETVPPGWDLTSIVCNDTDSSGDTGTGTATFDLDAGEVVKCTFTDTKLGKIIVEKQTIPDGDPQLFTFTGNANGTIGDDGQIIVGGLLPGTYNSTETVPLDWQLIDITCNDTSSANPSSGDLASGKATFHLEAGEVVKCTFTDEKSGGQPPGTIVVEKQTIPPDDPAAFEFTGTANGTIADNGLITVTNLPPENYTSTEVVPAGWDLTSIVCNDTESSGDTGTGTATFDLDAGEVVKCTFTDTKLGKIIVEKQTIPDGDPQFFTFTGDAFGFIKDGEQIVVSDLLPGTYNSTETVPGVWQLIDISCNDTNSAGNLATKTATFDLSVGEVVKCTFTNRDPSKLGTIVVEKQTIPGGESQLFTFAGDAAGTIGDDGQIVVGGLLPGTYDSTETVPLNWQLIGIGCNDTNSVGDLATKTATFHLEVGEVVKCTFTDEKSAGPPPPPVGGELYSVDKSALMRPYVVGLLGLLGAVATAVAITRGRRP